MIGRLPSALATERLVVRHVEPGDLEGLLVVHADDDVTRYLPYATWRSIDDARAWHARIVGLEADGKLRQFVVVDRADDRVVGATVLFGVDAVHRRAELGYVLGRRDWGRGLMREALDGLVSTAFEALALRRIEAHVDPRNEPSIRVLLRLGFVREGLMRERNLLKGEVVDSCVYGLLARDFAQRSIPSIDCRTRAPNASS